MKRLFAFLTVVFFIFLASTVQADGISKRYFVGLWEGVDSYDGSEAQRSITLNSDGTFSIIGQEPYTNGCGGERGLVTGTGVLEGGIIISEDIALICFNGRGPFENMRAMYIPDKLNRTLVEDFPDSNFEPMVLHKISK